MIQNIHFTPTYMDINIEDLVHEDFQDLYLKTDWREILEAKIDKLPSTLPQSVLKRFDFMLRNNVDLKDGLQYLCDNKIKVSLLVDNDPIPQVFIGSAQQYFPETEPNRIRYGNLSTKNVFIEMFTKDVGYKVQTNEEILKELTW